MATPSTAGSDMTGGGLPPRTASAGSSIPRTVSAGTSGTGLSSAASGLYDTDYEVAPENETLSDGAAMSLKWAFGFNKDILGGVHNISDRTRNAIFYVSAHSGVIYDFANRTQRLLQGHCNPITCCCVSDDKRWIATADAGPDSMIVVWDSFSATPIKTIFSPHPGGVLAMDMTPDAMFLVTVGAPVEDDLGSASAHQQQIALWEWTVDREGPLYVEDIATEDIQTSVRFSINDIHEIVSNGRNRVIFWNWESKSFKYYSPPLSKREFPGAGAFTQSIFVPDTQQAISATSAGNLVVWDRTLVGINDGQGRPTDRKAVKMLTMNKEAIQFIGVQGDYFFCAGDDGAVRFYDMQFRIIAWFEDLNAGPITSVSFANLPPPAAAEADGFTVPDFIVGTSKALIVGVEAAVFNEFSAEKRRGTLLAQGLESAVVGMAAHPSAPQVALAGKSGTLQLWNFIEKRLLMVRMLDTTSKGRDQPSYIAFDPSGNYLAVGLANGVLLMLEPKTFGDIPLGDFRNSLGGISKICFSRDGAFMATADEDRCVALYAYTSDRELVATEGGGIGLEESTCRQLAQDLSGGWIYVGKSRSHRAKITGLDFGMSIDGRPLLISVGEDRCVIEYDLEESSVVKGLVRKSEISIKVEQTAMPTTCMWYPIFPGAKEDVFVTANSDYKLKMFNASNMTCRRTALGPTYGGPLTRLCPCPGFKNASYVAYATSHKVVGLIKLPFDGNPARAMGLVAHPAAIGGIAFSHTGKWILTCGVEDMTLNLWSVNTSVLDSAVENAGAGIEPYAALIEDGQDGEFFHEMKDYFFYSKLRAQGENSTQTRSSRDTVPLEEIPNLMRALGYYPTEKEIENMCSEVKYASYLEDGATQDSITFEDFVKLYVNHRPVFGVGKENIQRAFDVLAKYCKRAVVGGTADDQPRLPWNELLPMLQEGGEALSSEELNSCLQSLVGDDIEAVVVGSTGPISFADKVLGFEDYEDEEAKEG